MAGFELWKVLWSFIVLGAVARALFLGLLIAARSD